MFGVIVVNDFFSLEWVEFDFCNFELKLGEGYMLFGLWIDMEVGIDDVEFFVVVDGCFVVEMGSWSLFVLIWECFVYVVWWMFLGLGDVVMMGVLYL